MTKAIGRKTVVAVAAALIVALFSSYSYAASSKVNISNCTAPSSITQGQKFMLKGKLSSNYKILRVEIGVVHSNGKRWTAQKYDNRNVRSRTFNIARADSSVKFRNLTPGKYYYRIYVHTYDGKVHTMMNQKFTVRPPSSTAVTAAPAPASTAAAPSTTQQNASSASGKVSLSGVNTPGTYTVCSNFNPVGTINSSEPITRVEIGIVYAPTNKWLDHKYDATTGGYSFNISKAASKLRFDQLPAGLYRYRIYVHTTSGVHLLLNHRFEVKSSGKPQQAVNWAVNVANDNSFNYGSRPAASRLGCYYCGTNSKKKPKGYEKTYVCMTFAQAAYAHGAKDPELLDDCKAARYTISLNDWNFKHYSCWEKIGLCKDLTVDDLLPGDVIIWWADDDYSGHASIYAGSGNIVDAAVEGWGADSIAVRKGSAASYLKRGASFDRRSYVMRYRK